MSISEEGGSQRDAPVRSSVSFVCSLDRMSHRTDRRITCTSCVLIDLAAHWKATSGARRMVASFRRIVTVSIEQ